MWHLRLKPQATLHKCSKFHSLLVVHVQLLKVCYNFTLKCETAFKEFVNTRSLYNYNSLSRITLLQLCTKQVLWYYASINVKNGKACRNIVIKDLRYPVFNFQIPYSSPIVKARNIKDLISYRIIYEIILNLDAPPSGQNLS